MSACLAPPARAAAIADSFDIPDFIAASTISRAYKNAENDHIKANADLFERFKDRILDE